MWTWLHLDEFGMGPGMAFNTQNLSKKLANVSSYGLFVFMTIYNYMHYSGRFGGNWTALTPKAYVFLVWIPVDVLLLGFILYQFGATNQAPLNAISGRFFLAGLLHSLYMRAFCGGHYTTAMVFEMFLSITLGSVYYTLKTNHSAYSILDTICIHLPFSLWFSWSVFLLPFSISEVVSVGPLSSHPEWHSGVWHQIWVVAGLLFLAASNWGFTLFTRKGDFIATVYLTIGIWGVFAGHYLHHGGEFELVYAASVASLTISVMGILFCCARQWNGRSGVIVLIEMEEREDED